MDLVFWKLFQQRLWGKTHENRWIWNMKWNCCRLDEIMIIVREFFCGKIVSKDEYVLFWKRKINLNLVSCFCGWNFYKKTDCHFCLILKENWIFPQKLSDRSCCQFRNLICRPVVDRVWTSISFSNFQRLQAHSCCHRSVLMNCLELLLKLRNLICLMINFSWHSRLSVYGRFVLLYECEAQQIAQKLIVLLCETDTISLSTTSSFKLFQHNIVWEPDLFK